MLPRVRDDVSYRPTRRHLPLVARTTSTAGVSRRQSNSVLSVVEVASPTQCASRPRQDSWKGYGGVTYCLRLLHFAVIGPESGPERTKARRITTERGTIRCLRSFREIRGLSVMAAPYSATSDCGRSAHSNGDRSLATESLNRAAGWRSWYSARANSEQLPRSRSKSASSSLARRSL
jgi:hypothetical protein